MVTIDSFIFIFMFTKHVLTLTIPRSPAASLLVPETGRAAHFFQVLHQSDSVFMTPTCALALNLPYRTTAVWAPRGSHFCFQLSLIRAGIKYFPDCNFKICSMWSLSAPYFSMNHTVASAGFLPHHQWQPLHKHFAFRTLHLMEMCLLENTWLVCRNLREPHLSQLPRIRIKTENSLSNFRMSFLSMENPNHPNYNRASNNSPNHQECR